MRKQISNWQKIRKTFQDIHLWLGLASGLIIVVVCFSGTAYVYQKELTEWASPHLYRVNETANSKFPVDQLVAIVEKEAKGEVSRILIPANESKTYQLHVKKEGEKSKFGTAWFINPYTAKIQGTGNDEGKMKAFMGYMFSLHRWLLFDKVDSSIIDGVENRELGRYLTGSATILFTLGCLSGLVIWFPNRLKNWKQGLKVKMSKNWKRTNHDLHNTLAFYSLVFLLIMGITGPQWSFDWYRTGLQKALGTYEEKGGGKEKNAGRNSKAVPLTGEQLITENTGAKPLNELLLLANEILDYPGDVQVSGLNGKEKEYTVTKTKTGFFAPAAGDRVTLDAYTGTAISTEFFSQKPFNEQIAGSIKALHIGTVFGGFSKLLYFLSCLIATSLPVTGTLIWINKLKKKKNRQKKVVYAVKRHLVGV